MKINTVAGTASKFGMVSVTVLMLSGIGIAGDNPLLQPGGYYNPWVVTPDRRGGATIQSEIYTGGNPLTPGNFGNPWVVERNGRELKIRPELPFSPRYDTDEEAE